MLGVGCSWRLNRSEEFRFLEDTNRRRVGLESNASNCRTSGRKMEHQLKSF